jgi:hypothetical protein
MHLLKHNAFGYHAGISGLLVGEALDLAEHGVDTRESLRNASLAYRIKFNRTHTPPQVT